MSYLKLYQTALAIGLSTAPLAASGKDLFFDSAGVRLRYVVRGEGPPVVLIHGFAANIELQWSGILDRLARDYRVIALDCRGHGRSEKPHDPAQYGVTMVADVVRLLDHLQIEQAHLVGYSMGALIASRMGAYHPERTLSVVLGGSGLSLDPEVAGIRQELVKSLTEQGSIEPLIRVLNPPARPQPSPLQVAGTNAFLMAFNDPQALAAVVQSFATVENEDASLLKPLCEMPALAIMGSDDPLRRGLDALKERLPHVRVVMVPAGDHVTTPATRRFLDGLREFLAESSSPQASANQAPAPGREQSDPVQVR